MYSGVPMGGVEEKWRKGPWTSEEDGLLIHHVNLRGEGRWNSVAALTGLKRNGKSCRLRWVNYLRPDLKRGRITPHEETIILDLHAQWGNRWSTIARSLPGRTDNEIKNYWRTHFKKKSGDDLTNKLKTRLLRRQKFQQEQRQQQLLHRQQKEADIKKIMSSLEQDDNEIGYMPDEPAIITRQQDDKMNNQEEYQSVSYSRIMVNGSSYYVPETPMKNEDVCVWDGLWNLEDFHGANTFCLAKLVGLQML